jgi:putative DNA methylase
VARKERKGKEAFVVATVAGGKVRFAVETDPKQAPTPAEDGTVGRTGATCVSCRTAVPLAYVRKQGREVGLGQVLMAMAAEGHRRRVYLAPDDAGRDSVNVPIPPNVPAGDLATNPRDFKTPNYGMTTFASLFTNRQLVTLTTFSDLVAEVRERVLQDALDSGLPIGSRLEEGGTDAAAYADAAATYLGLCASKMAMFHCTLARWRSDADKSAPAFGRQAIAMVWDFVEAQPFARAGGEWVGVVDGAAKTLERVPASRGGVAVQADASQVDSGGALVSTDPPYYDNIGYADLSDFFYVWMRRGLREVAPKLLNTMLVPKADELIADPYRHGGENGAREFFESGFQQVFLKARATASDEFPITVYYAFKQSESDSAGIASKGWETLLSGMLSARWAITATWPMRTESGSRLIGQGSNALASSIVLALRPRPDTAPISDRRGFLSELRSSLPEALRLLQQGAIAPVDLAQAAIGPGMAIFSNYSKVIEPSGQQMSVRDALQQINAILDEVLAEQEGDFDGDTRWCLAWFETHGFEVSAFGEAETLANAKNASVASLARAGVISSGGGKVKLFSPEELPGGYDPMNDDRISLWEVVLQMAKALGDSGLDATGRILARAEERGLDMTAAHELAYRLYALTEKLGLTQPGILFNALGSSWPEIRSAAKAVALKAPQLIDEMLDFDTLEEV